MDTSLSSESSETHVSEESPVPVTDLKALEKLRVDTNERPEPARNVFLPGDATDGLEYDPTAYDFLHRFTVSWPLLSIDPIVDGLGADRVEFPHQLVLLGGAQVDPDTAETGELTIFYLTDIYPTRFEEDQDMDPSVIQRTVDIPATINRVRSGTSFYNNCYPAGTASVAGLWTEDGVVSFINCAPLLKNLGVEPFGSTSYWHETTGFSTEVTPINLSTTTSLSTSKRSRRLNQRRNGPAAPLHKENPLCLAAFDNNGVEGYALACSPIHSLWLAGDVEGRIKAYQMRPDGSVAVDSSLKRFHKGSVEDLVFSRVGNACTGGCFLSCSSDGTIRIVDPRVADGAPLLINASKTDINVCDWSYADENLLVSGDEDGMICLWDVRQTSQTVQRLMYHKCPISSVRFSPNEPTVIAACSDDGTLSIWDIDVEQSDAPLQMDDFVPEAMRKVADLPPSLVFLHMGLEEPRELAFHPQITGSLIVTDLKGFQLFKPINLGHEYDDIEKDSDVELEE